MRRAYVQFLCIVLLTAGFFAAVVLHPVGISAIEATPLAQCLTEKKFTMYGKKSCSACAIQKGYFGPDFSRVPYVECDSNAEICAQKNIHAYPTWEDTAGRQYKGAIPLDKLWELARCSAPEATAPVTLPTLTPLDASASAIASASPTPTVVELHPLITFTSPAQAFDQITREQLFAAFFAGLLSFFAPCLLPLYPAYFSVITGFTFTQMYGLTEEHVRRRVFFSSLFFTAGFIVVFVFLGATGAVIVQVLEQFLPIVLRLSGLILITLGLVQTGVINIPSMTFDYAWNIQRRMKNLGQITAFVTGSVAALSWIPCVGPLLGSILLLSAESNSIMQGSILLSVYALGLTLPFILSGLYFPTVLDAYQAHRQTFHRISVAAGIFLVAFGVLLLMGQYRLYTGWFSGWIASFGELSPKINVIE